MPIEQVIEDWFKSSLEDVMQTWMLNNEDAVNSDPIKLDPLFAEVKMYYVHVHCRYEAIDHVSDRTCTDCFVVRDKYHSVLLRDELSKHKICWIRDRPHPTLPLQVARLDMLGKVATKILSQDFVCLQPPQVVFSILP